MTEPRREDDHAFTFVHHVHYLVSDLDATVRFMESAFGMRPIPDDVGRSPSHGVAEAIREVSYRAGETLIEFTQPLVADSKYGRRLAEHGPHVMHVAWGVPSLDRAGERLSAEGVTHQTKAGPRGYRTINVSLADAFGTHFQLAED
jgi:catechol 2,3-dioxygenase-like lactoylglutathione lyase family enzyme